MAGETSNIRWGGWRKISPREWHMTMYRQDSYGADAITVRITDYREWQLFINRNHIATFNTWDEASQAAPMLYSLHKDTV